MYMFISMNEDKWPLFLAVKGASREIKLLHDEGELRRVNQIRGARTERAHHRQIVSASRCPSSSATAAAAAAGCPRHGYQQRTHEGNAIQMLTMPLTTPAA